MKIENLRRASEIFSEYQSLTDQINIMERFLEDIQNYKFPVTSFSLGTNRVISITPEDITCILDNQKRRKEELEKVIADL